MPQSPASSRTTAARGPAPDLAAALADLPVRVRVHDLARRAGLNSKQAIAALAEAGVEVGSASSSVDREVAESLLTSLLSGDEPGPSAPADPSASTSQESTADTPDAATDSDDGRRRRRRGRRGRGHADEDADGPAPGASTDADGDGPAGSVTAGAEGPDTAPTDTAPTDAAPADTAPTDTADADHVDGDHVDGDGEKQGRRRRRGGRGRRGSGKGEASKDGGPSGDRSEPDADAAATGDDAEHGAATRSDSEGGKGKGSSRRTSRKGSSAKGAGTEDSEAADGADAQHAESEGGDAESGHADADAGDSESGKSSSRRRRRRRRRSGSSDGSGDDDPADTVVHVREGRSGGSESSNVQGVKGSTRLEAKRQRRRDSRDSRRRPQILSEAEFLARRESVDRVMAVRQHGDLAQVALLEDGVLVEHFVSRSGAASMIGNVYLGRVQNVLPSMEAAFVDIGKGRNAVLYAGEVNWDIAGLEGKARRIEMALSSGDAVLVQVSKDPIGHKGARLTTQISLPGRFLVYVPGGGATGISRKLPDTERKRLKGILDRIVPSDAGVIIRTAAEGVGEEELAGDVERLKAKWEEISEAAAAAEKAGQGSGPTQLYAEPDTLIKVIRDLFNSDINRLLIDGDDAWASVSDYVLSVAPELADRVSRYVGDKDVFAAFRIDEQITKALQRKVHLPSGGSLVIDRTEAMTVIDVNTGKFTGSGGNLEETVTRNNIEAAEEIVRQLRLRDIGGIIVVDFIDMVLESNRELVLRRLTECLGRDRTRHQVAEVTSLGLVQMTRKRMGLGLVEAFSEPCPHCGGRGILLHDTPADTGATESDGAGGSDRARRKGRKRGKGGDHDETAKFEPLVVERITADAKPNPLGPKPPASFRSASADSDDESGTAEPGGDEAGVEGVEPAGESIASDASGDEVPATVPEPDTQPDVPQTAAPAPEHEAGQKSGQAPELDQPTDGAPAGGDEAPRAKPARRRRAASRPAGSPAAATAVDIVLPSAPDGAADASPAAAGSDSPAPAANAADQDGGADGAVTPPAKPRRRRAATRAAGPASG